MTITLSQDVFGLMIAVGAVIYGLTTWKIALAGLNFSERHLAKVWGASVIGLFVALAAFTSALIYVGLYGVVHPIDAFAAITAASLVLGLGMGTQKVRQSA